MKSVSIIIPVYNEEDVIPFLLDRLENIIKNNPKYNWKFIFVNDGSTDKTKILIENKCNTNKSISIINLSKNFGHQKAMLAGFSYATSDYIGVVDADLQDPPELLIEMISKLENDHNHIFAKRIRRKGESFFKKITAYLYYRIHKFIDC